MKYDANTARDIALRGMLKMQTAVSEGKYSIENRGNGDFIIRKADQSAEYEVSVIVNPDNSAEYFGTCSCPFCNHGEENLICKHIIFCYDLLTWESTFRHTATDLRAALAEQAENDYYDRLQAEWEADQAYYRYGAEALI